MRHVVPTRTCVVRRSRRPVGALVRIVADDGVLRVVGAAPPTGRSAWVSADRQSLEQLQERPQLAGRSLRCRVGGATDLHAQAVALARTEAENAARRCWRSGLLRPLSGEPAPGATVLECEPSAAGPGPAEAAAGVCRLGVDRETWGRLTERPVTVKLELRSGRPARVLAAVLRRLKRLG